MPIKSPFPAINLPAQDIFSFLFERKDHPFPKNHTVFQDATTDKSYSFEDVHNKAVDFGKGLKMIYEWQKGDVLALFSPNHIDTPAITFGTLWAGGVVSPANPAYTVAELARQLKDSEARLVATQIELVGHVKAACEMAGLPEDCVILLGNGSDPQGRTKHWTNVRNISGAQRVRRAKINPMTDVAFLVYSSGTTGTPKGVKLSHNNLINNVVQVECSEQYNLTWNGSKTSGDIPLPAKGGDRILACLPFFHIYGLTMFVMSPMWTGVTTFVMSQFDLKNWCSLVQKHTITYSYIVPPIALSLSKDPIVDSYDLTSIRMTNCGAAPLSIGLIEKVFARTGIRIKQGYGLSETSPGAVHQRWDEWRTSAGSIGWLLPDMEAKFCQPIDEASGLGQTAQELAEGEPGELYVRGPNVFLGYHNNDAATVHCLSADGWFRTGDIGFMDKNKNMYITDRAKELIKYKGFQVAPAELESYLIQLPQVQDCAVVGVFREEMQTEVPLAYVVPAGKDITEMTPKDAADIVQWLDSRVANYKRLRGGVRFVASIPKNASGKILRRLLKEHTAVDETIRAHL
jgi:4-coumarate--CoA ligase